MPKKTQPSSEENIASAIALAQAILASDAPEAQKREALNGCVSQASEAAGQYDVPYWSYDVWHRVQPYSSGPQSILRMSHKPLRDIVHSPKSLVDAMLKNPAFVERALREDSFACLVSEKEQQRLKNSHRGFDRYDAAGIRVWDVYNERWLDEDESENAL